MPQVPRSCEEAPMEILIDPDAKSAQEEDG
jgi:hypothetical protein